MCLQPVLVSSSEHHARCRAGPGLLVRHIPEPHLLAFCSEQRTFHPHPHLPHCSSPWRKLRCSAVTPLPGKQEEEGTAVRLWLLEGL